MKLSWTVVSDEEFCGLLLPPLNDDLQQLNRAGVLNYYRIFVHGPSLPGLKAHCAAEVSLLLSPPHPLNSFFFDSHKYSSLWNSIIPKAPFRWFTQNTWQQSFHLSTTYLENFTSALKVYWFGNYSEMSLLKFQFLFCLGFLITLNVNAMLVLKCKNFVSWPLKSIWSRSAVYQDSFVVLAKKRVFFWVGVCVIYC